MTAALLMGKAVKLSRIGVKQIPCVQIRCPTNEFDEYIKMYFTKSFDFWALDKIGDVQLGDSVLIKPVEASERVASTITHTVTKVIARYGTKIDPITKKRMLNQDFMDKDEVRQKISLNKYSQ